MLRLCEGKVLELNLNEYCDGAAIIAYIEKNRLENFVFRVHEFDKYIGDFVYDDILLWDEVDDLSSIKPNRRIYFCENIFSEIRKLWSETASGRKNGRHLYCPIYDERDNFFCCAFDDAFEYGEHNDDRNMKNYFNTLLKYQNVSLCDLFTDILLYQLIDVNEMQFLFYQYLRHYDIPYQLVGEQWRILGESNYTKEQKKYIPTIDKSNVHTIYADSDIQSDIYDKNYYFRKDFLWIKYNNFANKLIFSNWLYEVEHITNALKSVMRVGFVRFPEPHEIGQTEDECFCYYNQVSLHFFHRQKDFDYLRNLLQVYGEKLILQHKRGGVQDGRSFRIIEGCNLQYVRKERKHKIVLVGPCVVRQEELMTEDTLVCQLQEKLEASGYSDYRVEGLTVPLENYDCMKTAIDTMLFQEGDILLFLNFRLNKNNSDYYLDLLPLFKSREKTGERWYTDSSLHLNQVGTAKVAGEIIPFITKMIGNCTFEDRVTVFPSALDSEEKEYIHSCIAQWNIEPNKGKKVGSIVMNCNPYTKGHDHLVRHAASQVDFLYLFVLEEDVSLFSFEDRYEIVKRNTKNIENVMVLPSGKSILSLKTLPTYFSKGEVKKAFVDASDDLRLFALGIAPSLNITQRFVGEEPKDIVTSQYNAWMEKVLPHYGIEVIEIPRLMCEDAPISASTVRKAICDGNKEIVKKMLTEATINYLWGSLEGDNVI